MRDSKKNIVFQCGYHEIKMESINIGVAQCLMYVAKANICMIRSRGGQLQSTNTLVLYTDTSSLVSCGFLIMVHRLQSAYTAVERPKYQFKYFTDMFF